MVTHNNVSTPFLQKKIQKLYFLPVISKLIINIVSLTHAHSNPAPKIALLAMNVAASYYTNQKRIWQVMLNEAQI